MKIRAVPSAFGTNLTTNDSPAIMFDNGGIQSSTINIYEQEPRERSDEQRKMVDSTRSRKRNRSYVAVAARFTKQKCKEKKTKTLTQQKKKKNSLNL